MAFFKNALNQESLKNKYKVQAFKRRAASAAKSLWKTHSLLKSQCRAGKYFHQDAKNGWTEKVKINTI